MITVTKTEKLPDTVNGWGFGGSTNKVKHFLSNGDIVVTGKAHYRQAPSERWTNLLLLKYAGDGIGESWTGSYHTHGVIEIPSLNSYLKKLNKQQIL